MGWGGGRGGQLEEEESRQLMKILDVLTALIKPSAPERRLIFVHINSVRSSRLFVCPSVRPTRRGPVEEGAGEGVWGDEREEEEARLGGWGV